MVKLDPLADHAETSLVSLHARHLRPSNRDSRCNCVRTIEWNPIHLVSPVAFRGWPVQLEEITVTCQIRWIITIVIRSQRSRDIDGFDGQYLCPFANTRHASADDRVARLIKCIQLLNNRISAPDRHNRESYT